MLWRILIDGKELGYVETGTGIVYDDKGQLLNRNLGYDTTDMSPEQPAWYVPTPPPTPEVITRRRLMKRWAFRERFTDSELVAIERAALDVPAGTDAVRNRAARVRVFLQRINADEVIDLERQAFRALVQALETAGVLATGRAAQVLDLNITANEEASP